MIPWEGTGYPLQIWVYVVQLEELDLQCKRPGFDHGRRSLGEGKGYHSSSILAWESADCIVHGVIGGIKNSVTFFFLFFLPVQVIGKQCVGFAEKNGNHLRVPGTWDSGGCCLWGCTESDTISWLHQQQQWVGTTMLKNYNKKKFYSRRHY